MFFYIEQIRYQPETYVFFIVKGPFVDTPVATFTNMV